MVGEEIEFESTGFCLIEGTSGTKTGGVGKIGDIEFVNKDLINKL